MSRNLQTSYHVIHDAHRKLTQHIDELRQWWQELDELGLPKFGEMEQRVRTLRAELAAHFEDEEADGFLSQALAVAPRFSRQADKLLDEHAEFLRSLDELASRLKGGEASQTSWPEVGREFDAIMERLAKHEADEVAILQTAFGEDVGTAD